MLVLCFADRLPQVYVHTACLIGKRLKKAADCFAYRFSAPSSIMVRAALKRKTPQAWSPQERILRRPFVWGSFTVGRPAAVGFESRAEVEVVGRSA